MDLCCGVRLGLVTCGEGLEIRFLVCSRNIVRLGEFGSKSVQLGGLQYVGRLVVRFWFLKWNYFFIVWVRQLANFRTRWCVEDWGVGKNLKPNASTSVSIGDSWWEERFLMALFLKLVWSSWWIRRLVILKFLVVRVSGKNFMNWGCAVLANFSEPSL